jgi:hypothetical protein
MPPDARMASLETMICQQTADVCGETFGPILRSIVLTGSLARHEATAITQGQATQMLGDAEFFLVFKEKAAIPCDVLLHELADRIESRLSNQGVRCDIELTPVHPKYFRQLRPTIFGYELRTHGRVVWGDPLILSLIRHFSAADIPSEDACRLLHNRMIECVEAAAQSVEDENCCSRQLSYHLVKLYLDMATSFLIFVGAFRPTYRARLEVLQKMAERDEGGDECPLPLRSFSEQVEACTAFKLQGTETPPFLKPRNASEATETSLRIIDQVHRLWHWELSRLTRAPASAAECELIERWMRRQALFGRARGWLVVVRDCGWHRSWRNWPRWLKLAHRGSPRHWIYALASELVFSMPELLAYPFVGRSASSLSPAKILRCAPFYQKVPGLPKITPWAQRRIALPVSPSPQPNLPEWVVLARGIAQNYHRFVEQTES